jgi:hypothetical protein
MRRISLVLLSLLTSVACWAEQPAIVSVEAQPLGSNVRRLVEALDALGEPLEKDVREAVMAAIPAQDAAEIQRVIDSHVLAVVTINPEERVSVSRGPVKATLQQAGFRPLLIKVVNHSTSTSRLQVTSPQSGPVYAGTAKLSMERQQQTGLLENQNESGSNERFLDLEVYRSPPLSPQLSGLEVEYAIVLLSSSEAGRREAVLHFDIGDGTADLEHRNELPVLFDVQPAVAVKLSIKDHDDQPGIARLEFRDSTGRVFPSQAKRTAPDFFFQSHVYRRDGETVLLPPGRFDVQYSRGPEYRNLHKELEVSAAGDHELAVRLDRWFYASEHGYFSGDHHIHAAGCAHYTHPTEGVSPADMFRQVQGEGLNVGCVLTWGPCFEYQRQYFDEQALGFDTNDTLLKYDLEISGFGSQALGHVCLLNLKNQTYPGSDETKTKGWPTWTTPVMRWAKEQGGFAGYAHSASGLAIDPEAASDRLIKRYDMNADGAVQVAEVSDALLPFPFAEINLDGDMRLSKAELIAAHERSAEVLPNTAIPEMNGVGAMEICVSTVAGVCDFISAMDTQRIQEWNTWYHLLNCGFPLKVSGETDFPCMSSRRVGKGRVYVHLGKNANLDFSQWCQGIALGRSYVSDGYAHFASISVNDVAPGYGSVELDGKGQVKVIAEVAFAPETPEGVAHGTVTAEAGRAVAGDTVILHRERSEAWVKGGEREVEIIFNGQPVASQVIPADGHVHRIERTITVDKSGWVAVRHFPQLHSNPVNVIVDKQPIRASKQSARWCIEMTELLWLNRQSAIAEAEQADARKAFDHAIEVLKQIEAES